MSEGSSSTLERGTARGTLDQLAPIALLAIVALAGWLRLHNLGSDSLWYDEIVSWRQSRGDWLNALGSAAGDNYPPLYNLLLNLEIHIAGSAEWALRLPSALLGTASVWIIGLLGRRIGGWPVGLLAALILAVLPHQIWYSQEARMYALLTCASLLLGWSAVAFQQSPSRLRAAVTTFAAIALLYSHIFGALVWLAIAAGALVALPRNQRRPFVVAQACALLAFLPWSVIQLVQTTRTVEHGFWIAPFSLQQFAAELSELLGGAGACLVLFFGLAAAIWPRLSVSPVAPPQSPGRVLAILWGWALLPIAAAVIISVAVLPLFLSRYLIGTTPAIILLASFGLIGLARTWNLPRAATAALSLLIGLLFYTGAGPGPRDDIRGAAAYLAANLKTGDCLAANPFFQRLTFEYYWPAATRCVLPFDVTPSSTEARTVFLLRDDDAANTDPLLPRFISAGWASEDVPFRNLHIFRLTRPQA